MTRILVLSPFFPYPSYDGGRMDVSQRLEALRKLGYHVHLLACTTPKETKEVEALERKGITWQALPIRHRQYQRLFSWKPYAMACRSDKDILDASLRAIQGKKFSILIAEFHHSLPLASYLMKNTEIPHFYLRVHNREAKYHREIANSSSLSVRKALFYLDSIKFSLFENKMLTMTPTPPTLLHISYAEEKWYKKHYPHLSQTVLPASIDINQMRGYSPKNKKQLLFIGSFFSANNVDGLRWYAQKIHPELTKACPEYQFVAAGNSGGGSLGSIKHLFRGAKNVKIYDTPKDLKPLYASSSVFVNPMQKGSGVKIKTLEAILNGLPVVSTPVGNEGTGLHHREHVKVASSPEKFIKETLSLLHDETIKNSMVCGAQDFIKTNYDLLKNLKHIMKN